jgi:hypothetical protein
MGPDLSIILATDGAEPAAEVLGYLCAQTAVDRCELVIATPAGELDREEIPDLGAFHSVQVIDSDPRIATAIARATAIEVANAPVVVLAETHCFPEPEWAEALIDAHRGPWAGVGPVFLNDNPNTVSWANLLVDYSQWLAPIRGGEASDLPGHNSSYKRELLLEYGNELVRCLEAESIMHIDLRAKGHRLYIEPRARVRHRNITAVMPAAVEHFHNGRAFGGGRCSEWGIPRRAFYAAASPLIPLLRMGRIIRRVRRRGRSELLPGIVPWTMLTLIAHALGEFLGYLTGAGEAAHGMSRFELYRDRYVTNLEQRALPAPIEETADA